MPVHKGDLYFKHPSCLWLKHMPPHPTFDSFNLSYFFLLTSDCFSFITSVAKFHHSVIAFFCQLFLLNTYENKYMCLSFCTCMCIWNNKAAAYLSNICRDSNKSQQLFFGFMISGKLYALLFCFLLDYEVRNR